MKKGMIVIFLFIAYCQAFGQDNNLIISCSYHQITFDNFSRDLTVKTGVRIYYPKEEFANLIVSVKCDSLGIEQVVEMAVKGSGLEVSWWNHHLILLKGEKLLTDLPEFKQKSKETDTVQTEGEALTVSEERYLTGRKADVIQTVRIGKTGALLSGTKAKVLGRILDEETGAPIYSATIYITELRTGEVSDVNGFLTIMLKPGKYNAVFEFLGYEKKKYLLDVISDGSFVIQMKRAVITMKEFVVYGDRQMNMKIKDPGLDKISMKTIKELPMMMGERDILKVSGMLPGIVSTGEGASGLNVRGGSSDQNAFYINKIPVYNTAHMFGFFPAFNSDIIKDFAIYKGHIPAQYGGRLSSVFNILTRQGNRKRFTVHGGLSPITGNLVVEGPLKKDTCSVLLSARTSYSDWILKQIEDPDIRSSSANFYDFSGAINYDLRKTQMSLFVYHSNDRFRLSDINKYSYSNNGGALTFSHVYSNSLRGELTLIGSRYNFETTDRQEVSRAYEHAYKMEHYEARADIKQVVSDVHSLDYGVGFILYKLNRGDVKPYGINSLKTLVELGKEQGIESAAYFSDSYDFKPWLNLTLGARYTLFNPLGEKTVYTYADGAPRDIRYINDTLQFGANEPVRWYSEPDFRAAINIETDMDGSVKLAFNQMHQNLFMLNNTITVAPNTQWKLADYHLQPSRSQQFSLGIFRLFVQSGLEASLEGYYKKTFNAPEFKDGADFLESPLVETTVLQGAQRAWGLEFYLKRSNRKLEGWFSYTFSRSFVKIDGENAWDQINSGKSFPANFDIPHALNIVLNYHLSRRITFSSILTYQTGKPITYPVSVYYVDGVPTLDYSARNAYRIPDYFRTDVSLAIEGNLKKNKLLHSSLILSLYNATGRDNPYSVYFKTEHGRIKSYRYAVIGVPVFTATWIFKLGNYASE